MRSMKARRNRYTYPVRHRTQRCKAGKRKARYADRISAILAIARMQHKDPSSWDRVAVRAYRCPVCHDWHLTSS